MALLLVGCAAGETEYSFVSAGVSGGDVSQPSESVTTQSTTTRITGGLLQVPTKAGGTATGGDTTATNKETTSTTVQRAENELDLFATTTASLSSTTTATPFNPNKQTDTTRSAVSTTKAPAVYEDESNWVDGPIPSK